MRKYVMFFTIAAGVCLTGPATARDNFKNGSSAYTVGLYGSAARHWMALATKGHAPAQYDVGRMLYYGQGMRRDPIEAYKWFLIAGQNGVRRSKAAAQILAERMTRHEIVEATVRARDWHLRNSR
jgi:TPR repeat protein